MNRLVIPAALAACVLSVAVLADPVAPAQVAQQIRDAQTAPFVLDVRTAEEFAGGRVPGAKNIPVQELADRLAEVPKDRPVVVYCHSGRRAQRAETLLRERGYANVSLMEGSMVAWEAAKLPIEK